MNFAYSPRVEALRQQLHAYRHELAEMVAAKDARLQDLGSSAYLQQQA